jgi:NAD(P)-dependent dehydrogenase (short-subunit alcohol dehydrogenase family)
MAVVVSGGTRGIGLEIAAALAAPGAAVVVGYRHDDAAAGAACDRLAALGARPVAVAADVGTADGAAQLLAAVPPGEPVAQLVHCAVEVVAGGASDADAARFDHAVAVNGMGLLHLARAALPRLTRGSLVLFLSSRGGRVVIPGYASVGVGKAMGEALVRYLAVELAPRRVRVNAIAPGMLDTAAVRALYGERTDAVLAAKAESIPAGRGIRHDDYLGAVAFLASPAAEMVTGQTIAVYGGADLLG